MSLRIQIDRTFDGRAFQLPLFYSFKGGLRFALSEGGHYLNQFLTAHRKCLEVCQQVFEHDDELTVCLKFYARPALLSCLSTLRVLRDLELLPVTEKEHWVEQTETESDWGDGEESQDYVWHHIAFKASRKHLTNALWLAFASDFGPIKPRASVDVYLFNLKKKVLVWPYDDRGMDIVGPNKAFLRKLYHEFNHYLLDYHRQEMDKSFRQD